MVYILCVIHTAYWMSLLGEPWRSLLLIEMPLIFFISGASLSVTNRRRSFTSHVANRLKRVWLPYIIYMVLLIIIAWLVGWIVEGDVWRYNESWHAVLCQLSLQNSERLPVPWMWHLWFVLPYIVVAVLFWFEQRLADRYNRWWIMAGAVALWAVGLLRHVTYINEVTAYNVFFLAGYLFYRRCSLRTVLAILLCSLAVVAAYCLWLGDFTPMQKHKFGASAPDLLFMAYGTAALCVVALLLWSVRLPGNRLLSRWNAHGYTIYLWQNVAYWIAVPLMTFVWPALGDETPSLRKLLLAGAVIFVISTVMSFVTAPVERWLTRMAILPFQGKDKTRT